MRQSVSAGLAAVALLLGCGGCGSPGVPSVSSSRVETTIKGVVRVRGKPVNNGTVTFNAANVRRPHVGLRQVSINKDGTYTVKTLVGENYVQVSCKELSRSQNRMFGENELMFMAEERENTFDIDIAPTSVTRPSVSSHKSGGSSK
jgi:hypothetical protein